MLKDSNIFDLFFDKLSIFFSPCVKIHIKIDRAFFHSFGHKDGITLIANQKNKESLLNSKRRAIQRK